MCVYIYIYIYIYINSSTYSKGHHRNCSHKIAPLEISNKLKKDTKKTPLKKIPILIQKQFYINCSLKKDIAKIASSKRHYCYI